MIGAILFDNDGVLVDTERLYFEACKTVLGENGVELTRELYRELYLLSNSGAWHLMKGAGEAEIERLREERSRICADMLRGGVELIPGAKQTVATLAERFPLAIVTSSAGDHFRLIHQHTDILQHFEFILTREDYARSKPDPEPYLLAAKRIGHPPGACLVVEDSERGLIAAHKAGIPCAVIPTAETRGSDFSKARWVLNDIMELLELAAESP